jgi:hypothetical protein
MGQQPIIYSSCQGKVALHRLIFGNKPAAADCLQESSHATEWKKARQWTPQPQESNGAPELPSSRQGALVSSSTQLACSGHWGCCRFPSSLELAEKRRTTQTDERWADDASRSARPPRSSDLAAIPPRDVFGSLQNYARCPIGCWTHA